MPDTAEKLILEIAALERDSNDEFGDVILDGTSDLFDRIQSCAAEIKTGHAKARLEYLRGEIAAERISYGELAELQSLSEFIEPGDFQLLEAAGVAEDGKESANA